MTTIDDPSSTTMVRKLSFNKRPYSKSQLRRVSQMSTISGYPPQSIDTVDHDEDYERIHQRYRGVSFCGTGGDYDERIRVPRMSLSTLFHQRSKNSRESSKSRISATSSMKGSSSTSIPMIPSTGSEHGLNSLKEGESTQYAAYKPASYDLTKGLRNINYNTPPSASTLLNNNFQLNQPTVMRKSSISVSPSNVNDGIHQITPGAVNSNSTTSVQTTPPPPIKQINEPARLIGGYIPPVLRPNELSSSSSSSNTTTMMIPPKINNKWDNEPSRSHWKLDESRSKCADCETPFGIFLRRHHCRHCGDIFCFNCLNQMANLNILAQFERPNNDLITKVSKICNKCHEDYITFLKTNKGGYGGSGGGGDGSNYNAGADRKNSIDVPSDWVWSSF